MIEKNHKNIVWYANDEFSVRLIESMPCKCYAVMEICMKTSL